MPPPANGGAPEVALTFDCRGDRMVGIVSVPEAASDLGLLIIVGGPQYRVGSHRQFVQLARAAAAAGHAAMRFDTRGMGDADGAQRDFEAIEDDLAAAVDALQRTVPAVRRVVMWGLCGGATAALLYHLARSDPRIAGLVLVNPWVRTEATQAITRVKHYYLQRLLQKAFWLKLAKGAVGPGAVAELLGNLRRAAGARLRPASTATAGTTGGTLEQRMARGWQRFRRPILLLLSGQDYTAKEFLEVTALDALWRANLALPSVTRVDLPDADHTFSTPGAQQASDRAALDWMRGLQAASGGSSSISSTA